jgi:hypothetical protein
MMKERPTKCVFKEKHILCVPSADNTQTGSTPHLHLFGTYDVTYTQFHQDPLGFRKMALLHRRNM